MIFQIAWKSLEISLAIGEPVHLKKSSPAVHKEGEEGRQRTGVGPVTFFYCIVIYFVKVLSFLRALGPNELQLCGDPKDLMFTSYST